jgi:large subunit ribosomal protein L3
MPKHGHIRHGTLQFYPRVRAKKIIPRVNWNAPIETEKGLKGFIAYKVGMTSVFVRDNGAHSMTKGQRITIPATVLECPTMKILSVRFYKNDLVLGEVLNHNMDKDLKKKIKMPKTIKAKMEDYSEADDLRVLVYSEVKKTGIKKTADFAEVALGGNFDSKLSFVKEHLNKEISIKDVFPEGVVDIRGVTIGKGTQGPTKRFGLTLRAHKSEKGVRGPGSIGPWHPCRLTFTVPRTGQMGFFTRIVSNSKILSVGKISEKDINPEEGFKHFGKIKTDYIVLFGSVQGPTKRQVLLTTPIRPSKKQLKRNYEVIELR